jgi:hypothetical protein
LSATDRGRRAGVEHDERRLFAPELFGREVELAVLEAAHRPQRVAGIEPAWLEGQAAL